MNDIFLINLTQNKYIIKFFMYFDKNKIEPSIALQKFLSERGMAPSIVSEGVYGSTPYIIQKYADNENAKQNWFLFGKTLALMHYYFKSFLLFHMIR